jgi:anaerobic selenocysteine-containing dehydrogenase
VVRRENEMSTIIKTICGLCATNDCGMDVYVEGGKIQKIGGMLENPQNKGTLCPKGLAAAQLVTSPERLKFPLKRGGNRGEGKWKKITWDEALDIIANKFTEVKEKHGPQAVGAVRASGAGWTSNWDFLQRFMYAFGSPNLATNCHVCYGPRASSYVYTLGGIPEPDFENTNCMLFWAFNPAETYLPNYGSRFIDAKERGAKLIVIDPRFSRTAAKADIHVPLRPGTDGALALGMANVIINEGLHDEEFIEKWTHGFEEFANFVGAYTPERVAGITDVPEKVIRNVAAVYATIKPALLRDGNGIDQSTNAVQTARAIQMLPILTGNIAVPGGQVLIPNLPWPDIALKKKFFEELEQKSVSKHPMFHRIWSITHPDLFDAISTGIPYEIKALLINGSAPLITDSQPQKISEAFAKVDFLVTCDLFMTASAQIADIVLPIQSFLECTRLRYSRYRARADCQHIALQNKAVDPVGESKSDEDFFLSLAGRVGLEEYFPWKNIEDEIAEAIKPLGVTIEDLRKNPGGVVKTFPPEDLYRGHTKYDKQGFNTPTKKAEISSTIFKKFGYDPLPLYDEPMESPISRPDLVRQFPLVCNTGIKTVLYTHTQFRTLLLLKQIMPTPWIAIHPLKAEELGIHDGDTVLIQSSHGQINLKAQITEEVADPATVFMPYGWGQPYTGDYPIANTITPDSPKCPISTATPNHSFLCKIQKI